MARYERMGGQGNRLGSFESYSGRSLGNFGATADECARLTQNWASKLSQANQYAVSDPSKVTQLMTEFRAAKAQADSVCAQVPKTSSSTTTGSTAAANMNAIATMLAPLAQAGATVAATKIQSDAMADAMRRDAMRRMGQPAPVTYVTSAPESSSSSTGLIIGGLLATAVIGGIIFFATKKK